MLERSSIQDIASSYKGVTIGIFGSHSAIETGESAKRAGLPTYLVAQKGREKIYTTHYKNLYDKVLLLDNFGDLLDVENQEKLRQNNVVMIPNRSFFVYLRNKKARGIEEDFEVPIFGARNLLAAEDRTAEPNQYDFMKKAGIPIPEVLKNPEEIDVVDYPVIIKVQQKDRPLERAFPVAFTYNQYLEQTEKLLEVGLIDEDDLKKAVIEEYCVGPYYNVNSHVLSELMREKHSKTKFDFVGFGRRDQTSESGYRGLPAAVQLSLDEAGFTRTMEEAGHKSVTMRESIIPQTLETTEMLIDVLEALMSPGMIGMFGVQGALPIDENRKPVFKVFDLSFRVPGDPAIAGASPYIAPLNIKYEKLFDTIRTLNGFGYKKLEKFRLKKIEAPLDLTMLEITHAHLKEELGRVVT